MGVAVSSALGLLLLADVINEVAGVVAWAFALAVPSGEEADTAALYWRAEATGPSNQQTPWVFGSGIGNLDVKEFGYVGCLFKQGRVRWRRGPKQ